MTAVRITVTLGARTMSIDDVPDRRIATALRGAGQDIARRLEGIRCAEHGKTASNVRVHFDQRGNADLQYESCCEALGKQIRKTLG
jgi:hypothetical protein